MHKINNNIRNFCIIAHIDHGKSTLADRIIEFTNSVDKREMSDQILDNMEIERERGITIKSRAVTLLYHALDGINYTLNLIDTPGHVDFNYEVSRSLSACEGALLVVDASQGIEAQTLANTYLAIDANLEVVPVINKIDLPSAEPDRIANEIEEIIGISAQNSPRISAKTGLNIQDVLECIIKEIPPPKGLIHDKLRALIFDSFYDSYRGVVIYIRVVDGRVKTGDKIRFMANMSEFIVTECGFLLPTKWNPVDELYAGQVGYLVVGIKTIHDSKVGDTVTLANNPTKEPLPGYRNINPMVFCGIYPIDGTKYPILKDALEKLHLNDAALTYEPETSVALGFGFRCGFLGLLHAEIIQERLEREFNLDLMITAPSVVYKIQEIGQKIVYIDNPTNFPSATSILTMEEPIARAHIYSPSNYIGSIMKFCQERRGEFVEIKYINSERADIIYDLPLNEIVYDFFDTLKSKTKGYASFDYEITGYKKSDLVKLGIMLGGEPVDALSIILHRSKSYSRGSKIVKTLKEKIPRQQFEVAIQACIGTKIIARETVKSYRKDVIAKCYGGDITRKRKLLEKQKEGKKRMKKFGSIEVPNDAFLAALKVSE
ncbi:MAG: elongation factor 4 [Candidatus Improbicoccus devescovinae]|nr:MAG: elongation factor 4 [Candidatus Improbicoccus devescovinae]